MDTALKAIEGIEDKVDVRIAHDHRPGGYVHLGYAGGIFIEGMPYRPYEHLGSSEDLRTFVLERYRQKQFT
jgi:hypothetical protein